MRAHNPDNPLLLSQLMLLGLLACSSAVLAHEERNRAPAPSVDETAPAAEFCTWDGQPRLAASKCDDTNHKTAQPGRAEADHQQPRK